VKTRIEKGDFEMKLRIQITNFNKGIVYEDFFVIEPTSSLARDEETRRVAKAIRMYVKEGWPSEEEKLR
jgi:hypothetical protein